MKKYLALSAAMLAGGCVATEMSSTPRMITYIGVSNFTIEQTTTNAQVHCSQFGRDALLIPDAVQDGTATFQCVDP